MKELQTILRICRQQQALNQPAALATVVKLEGSAYRRPGARMLITPDGSRIGSISGGCLEADVVSRAQQVMSTGEPHYVLYDTRHSNGDLIVELGCKGAVGILIERTDRPELQDSLAFLDTCAKERREGGMVTLVRSSATSEIHIGERLMLTAEGTMSGVLATRRLPTDLPLDIERVMTSGHAETRSYTIADCHVEALLEPIHPPVALMLCGAGQDCDPLYQMARLLGWQVTIMDHRPAMLSPERFAGAATRLIADPDTQGSALPIDPRTAVVVMTHSYHRDKAWLRTLLRSHAGYVGLLGARKRAEQMAEELCSESLGGNTEGISRLHSPTGLDIGSETPEEIALAVLAEIQAVLSHRPAGFLRDRKGPIHPLAQTQEASTSVRAFQVLECPLSA